MSRSSCLQQCDSFTQIMFIARCHLTTSLSFLESTKASVAPQSKVSSFLDPAHLQASGRV